MRKRLGLRWPWAKEWHIGDIVQIETPSGYAYGQVTHHRERKGDYVRIFVGLHQSPVKDACRLVLEDELMTVILSRQMGWARIVGRADVPESARPFPRMRAQGFDMVETQGRSSNWWIDDGEREYPVGPLTPELAKLSVRVWYTNRDAFLRRVMSQRKPEDWPEG